MASTTWNPADKAATVTLTNANLTATNSGTAGNNGVRSIGARTTKLYFEAQLIAGSTHSTACVGVATAAHLFTAAFGADLLSGGYRADGQFFFNNNNAASFAIANNDILRIAFDPAARFIWIDKNGANNWNNQGGLADPGTGSTNGSGNGDMTGAASGGTWFAMATVAGLGDSFTAKFDPASWTYALPSGYSALPDLPGLSPPPFLPNFMQNYLVR